MADAEQQVDIAGRGALHRRHPPCAPLFLPGWGGGGGCPVGRMGCRMLQTSSPKSSILQQVFVQSKEEGGRCQRILGSSSPGREGGSWHPAPGCRRQDRSLSSPLRVHGRPLQGTTTKKPPVSCFSRVEPGDISWHPLAVQHPLSPPPRPCWALHTSRPPHGSCCHPPSPRMPWVGTAVAPGGARNAACLAGARPPLMPSPTPPCPDPAQACEHSRGAGN